MASMQPHDADAETTHRRARLAQEARDRRLGLGLSIRAAATAAGVARGTWLGLEETTRRTADNNYAGIEHALQWAPGSIAAILDGGDPTEQPRHGAPAAARPQPTEAGSDEALIRVMRSDLDDKTKAKIVRMLIAEQQRFERERAERAEELIRAFRDDG